MADLPIPFTPAMVRAILREIEKPGTGKTQTRRTIEPTSKAWASGQILIMTGPRFGGTAYRFEPRYRAGDRLYVREAWRTWAQYDDVPPLNLVSGTHVAYEATPNAPNLGNNAGKFRQGMHMPRWASRITLIVTDVRVQRLQEISEDDAVDEGMYRHRLGDHRHEFERSSQIANLALDDDFVTWQGAEEWDCSWATARQAYADYWDSLNEARGYGWDTNPWIAAYTFRPILGNIDQVHP